MNRELCAVKFKQGDWPVVALAFIMGENEDDVTQAHVIGEPHMRDQNSWLFIWVIREDDNQAKAARLAASQWGQLKVYPNEETIKAAILAA